MSNMSKLRSAVTALAICMTGAPLLAEAQTVSIGSNPQGSLFYAVGTAISKVMSEKTGKQYRVAPFGGSSTYLPMLARGELEFGLTNSGEASFAFLGTGMFDGRKNPQLRMVANLIPATNGWMVAANSDIKTMEDLRGKRVTAGFTAGRTFHYLATAALAANRMSWDDVVRVPVPEYVQGVDMLIAGRVDAAYSTVGVAAAQRAMASIPGGIRFLSLDHSGDVVKRIESGMPAARPTTMRPGKAKNGIVEDPTNLIRTQFVLLASETTSEGEVYELTKIIHESKDKLVAALGAFARFEPSNMYEQAHVPYHEGALRYYREIGVTAKR